MALDPNISLGVRPLQIADPLAQYGQIATIQNAQNQNQLAQFQLGAAQRQDLAQNALSSAYKSAFNPKTNQFDEDALIKNLAMNNAGQLIPDIQSKFLARKKELGQIEKTGLEVTGLQTDQRIKLANKAISDIASLSSPEQAILSIDENLKKGNIDVQKADLLKGKLATAPSFNAWQKEMLVNILDAKDRLEQSVVTTKDTDRGGYIERQTYNKQGEAVGKPVQLAKTQTFADQTAAARLNFERSKFDFERANPGYELKEAEDGSIVGVNKRTLQAFPVNIGGASPAVAPVAGGTGMPGARAAVPSVVPAQPGVVPAAVPSAEPTAAGRPLMGKGTAMTEAQSNAAMFGGAMAQAIKTINQIETSGTTKAAVVPSLLTGLAKMLPFGSGEGVSDAILSSFNADPTGLIGPNAAQQRLAQAQLAFATAYLRKTSGAAFGASEVANTIREFFPLQGEGQSVIKQKSAARDRAMEGMRISTSSEGKKYIDKYQAENDPLRLGTGNR